MLGWLKRLQGVDERSQAAELAHAARAAEIEARNRELAELEKRLVTLSDRVNASATETQSIASSISSKSSQSMRAVQSAEDVEVVVDEHIPPSKT